MEKRDKIIIVGLIIVILALIAGLCYMLMGNNSSAGNGSIPDGMEVYAFNSEFKMAVPEDARFLKQWNLTGEILFGSGYTYFDKDNEIQIAYADSPLVTHEFLDALVNAGNSSGNVTFEFEGDMIIAHNIKNSGKVTSNPDDAEFKETIFIQKGHMMVGISGNDLDLIKSMANSIEFYE